MKFVKRLLVKVNCPSIEKIDTKKPSADISRVDIFIGDKSRVQNRESVLCFFYQMQHFQVHFRNGATTKVAMVEIAHVF